MGWRGRKGQLGSAPPGSAACALDNDMSRGTEGRTACGQGVDFAVPANVWKPCGMPSLDSPQGYHTNPPPDHTAPEAGLVETVELFSTI